MIILALLLLFITPTLADTACRHVCAATNTDNSCNSFYDCNVKCSEPLNYCMKSCGQYSPDSHERAQCQAVCDSILVDLRENCLNNCPAPEPRGVAHPSMLTCSYSPAMESCTQAASAECERQYPDDCIAYGQCIRQAHGKCFDKYCGARR